MNVGQLLFVLRDLVNYLERNAMLRVDGIILLDDINKDIGIAQVIETSLKEHGVTISTEVDDIIEILPIVLKFARKK